MKFIDEINNVTFEVLDDFMTNVVFEDGTHKPLRTVFPDVKDVDFNIGIIIMKDNTIRCSIGCSSAVATYDGCKLTEVFQMWGN